MVLRSPLFTHAYVSSVYISSDFLILSSREVRDSNMAFTSPKGTLPFGWIVKTSKHYPDRIYYFNINTGVSTWECPELDPPRVKSEEEIRIEMENKNSSVSQLSPEHPRQSADPSTKSCTPPTAVVVPVVHKRKEMIGPSSEKNPKARKQIDLKEEIFKKKKKRKVSSLNSETIGNKEDSKKLKRKKKKKVSPLNREINVNKEDSERKKLTEIPKDQFMKDTSPGPSSSYSSIKDIEMQDVSMDLMEDLSEKKETVFDATACYYIVIDTNVLIGELPLVSELKDLPLDGCGPPHIFIPWVVIEELDKVKSQRNANVIKNDKGPRGAAEAIRFLNSVLGKHPRFHGQSPAEAEEWAKTYSKCNDDKILECCMALKDKMPAEKVILLTNDKNLVNKARICNINVHNFESMMKKVKPDTHLHYKEDKRKKKEKDSEESSPPVGLAAERLLKNKHDACKRKIHSIMSNAHCLLKNVLSEFLSKEMFEAYGKLWLQFEIETKVLKGILDGIKRYWRTVFTEFFSEKDKRNFELLLEKVSRPEGFLGDKDECLLILSAIEDAFCCIKRRQPNFSIPIEKIQDFRVACNTEFIAYCEADSTIRSVEEKCVRKLLDNNWNAICQLCGIILDYYQVPYDFDYDKVNLTITDFEIRRIMTVFYPAVQTFKKLFESIYDAVKNCKPVKALIKQLATALLQFIPSLGFPGEVETYPYFTPTALERFFTCSTNRQSIEVGIKQIRTFDSKLDEVLRVMSSSNKRKQDAETMICD